MYGSCEDYFKWPRISTLADYNDSTVVFNAIIKITIILQIAIKYTYSNSFAIGVATSFSFVQEIKKCKTFKQLMEIVKKIHLYFICGIGKILSNSKGSNILCQFATIQY